MTKNIPEDLINQGKEAILSNSGDNSSIVPDHATKAGLSFQASVDITTPFSPNFSFTPNFPRLSPDREATVRAFLPVLGQKAIAGVNEHGEIIVGARGKVGDKADLSLTVPINTNGGGVDVRYERDNGLEVRANYHIPGSPEEKNKYLKLEVSEDIKSAMLPGDVRLVAGVKEEFGDHRFSPQPYVGVRVTVGHDGRE